MEVRVNEQVWVTTLFESTGDAVITTDSRGTIQSMNRAAEVLTAWAQKDALGKPVSQVLKLREAKTLMPVESNVGLVLNGDLPAAVSTGLLLVARDGISMPIEKSVAASRDDNGNVAGATLTFRVMAEPRPTLEAFEESFHKIQQAKREWEFTVDSIADLILLIDNSGQVIRANRTVEAWNLGRVTEVSSRQFHDMIHPTCDDAGCSLRRVVQDALQQTREQHTLTHELYDKELGRYLLIKAQPVLDTRHQAVHATVIIIQDISERKRAEESLLRYAAELQARNEELDAFAHTVAHDLKNPVGLVIGFSEFLLQSRDTTSYEEVLESLRTIARIGHKMNNIIRELLLLAQLRNEQVETEPLDMGTIVAEAQQRLAHMIQNTRAEIVAKSSGLWPPALGYAPWVEEMLVNYISNALKYGGQPPRVELGATEQPDGRVRFWVSDNGNGLTPQQQAALFTPFQRLDQVRAEGHGLGLSIVRRIAEKLGGQVGVESSGVPGQGSVFYFTLPAVQKAG